MKAFLVFLIVALTSNAIAKNNDCVRLAKPNKKFDSVCVQGTGINPGDGYQVSFAKFHGKGPYQPYDQFEVVIPMRLVNHEVDIEGDSRVYRGSLQVDIFSELDENELNKYAIELALDSKNPRLIIGQKEIALTGAYEASEAMMGGAASVGGGPTQADLDEIINSCTSSFN